MMEAEAVRPGEIPLELDLGGRAKALHAVSAATKRVVRDFMSPPSELE